MVWDILGCTEEAAHMCWSDTDIRMLRPVAEMPSACVHKPKMPVVTLTQPMPTYLGPEWHARKHPESVVLAFLRQRGGSASTSNFQELYAANPWLGHE